MAQGVFKEDILTFLRCDFVAVLRPHLTKEEIRNITMRIREKEGTEYDFDFDFKSHCRLSCTELVYWGFKPYIEKLGIALVKRFSGETITPDDFLNSNLEVIFVSSVAVKKVERMTRK